MPLNLNINRVSTMIRQYQESISQRLANGTVTQQKLDDLSRNLNMDVGEYCRFQQLKSLAFAGGKMMLEEAQTIYVYLGESVETFNVQPVAVKAVLTKVFEELLEMQISLKRKAG